MPPKCVLGINNIKNINDRTWCTFSCVSSPSVHLWGLRLNKNFIANTLAHPVLLENGQIFDFRETRNFENRNFENS